MREVVIVGACRTAIGDFNGSLKDVAARKLGAIVLTEAARRARVEPTQVDEVILGSVLPHGQGQNPARQAVLEARWPMQVECLTINKVCGSGLKAVMLAAQAIACGDAEIAVAGGMENMNQAPFLLPNARFGLRMGAAEVQDAMVRDGLWDINNNMHMGSTAEHIADKFGISREVMDQFAAHSYAKALAAQKASKFAAEIVPVELPAKKGAPESFVKDEIVRETPLGTLGTLRAAFRKDGRVTAGNSSKIADGAAALVLTTPERAAALGAPVLARIVAQGAAAQDPMDVLVTPILSIPKVLKKAGLRLQDIDLHEVNEAFAVSTVAVQRTLGIPEDRLNVFGGAIALGHPIGASGARGLVTLLSALADHGKRRGMVSLCLGGGEAVSLIVERP